MAQPAAHPPDVTRNAAAAARALTSGLRAWHLYSADHPALALAIDRLVTITRDVTQAGPLMPAVTPHCLLVDGVAMDAADPVVAECARVLHDLDLLQVSIVGAASEPAVRELLTTLTVERSERRRGAAAAMWAEAGHPEIVLEQIPRIRSAHRSNWCKMAKASTRIDPLSYLDDGGNRPR